ncbi:MAG: electron transfer flavoprotein subunit alpha/FixB family protein [Candidatus Marinimicrobia bacterium]|jgi:electron transfer flavoprotein alpha subunit|nr:electron transfer flavoprotein subunit alpha/FixB family protein [Candidatus Neomarinimicrobiota bacterium]MDX9777430.1 electron transfer flavoprotein subunit alpha/FixB family protein [bacterium]
MSKIIVHQEAAKNKSSEELIKVCPFNAIEFDGKQISINAGCRMCKICIKRYPDVFEFIKEEAVKIDKSQWRGIAVYIDHIEDSIHPVSFELIGKAREMAAKIGHPVYCLLMGDKVGTMAEELLHYGADAVYVYDKPELHHFRIEPYTAVFEDFINRIKPSIVLVGGTTVGRSLAPRVAARFRTGLTADCTLLDVQENTDLDQIRPAYGGNIMAHIHTPNHRPQFATVRYKIFNAPERRSEKSGKLKYFDIGDEKLASRIRVLEVRKKEKVKSIEDSDVIIVAGRAFKKEEDLSMVYELADLLGGMVATTRPLIEAGWADPRLQIGLSGRTVKPKLIITCGVSGAIQFVAGMNSAETIIAINADPHAQIFSVAHYAVIGDIYEILPEMIARIKAEKINNRNIYA